MKAQGNMTALLRWSGGCLDFSQGCLIMGVLNVTPDSFSDGGLYLDEDAAVAHGLAMVEQHSRPSSPGCSHAMSSPTVQTFQPSCDSGGISIARLVLPQADGNAQAR